MSDINDETPETHHKEIPWFGDEHKIPAARWWTQEINENFINSIARSLSSTGKVGGAIMRTASLPGTLLPIAAVIAAIALEKQHEIENTEPVTRVQNQGLLGLVVAAASYVGVVRNSISPTISPTKDASASASEDQPNFPSFSDKLRPSRDPKQWLCLPTVRVVWVDVGELLKMVRVLMA